MIVQVYCKYSGSDECKGGQRFCQTCKHQFCKGHFGIESKSRCSNCIKRLMDIEDATIKAFNDSQFKSSGLPQYLYPGSLLEEIRLKKLENIKILKAELKIND